MKNEIVAVVLVLAIMISGGTGYLLGVTSKRTITSGSSSTTTITLTCTLAPKGSALYIKITLDGGRTPVANATIDATPVETCNGVNTTIAIIWHPAINTSGIATLDASDLTYYSITVHYGSQSYPFTADVQNSAATCAGLSVPSGSLSIISC